MIAQKQLTEPMPQDMRPPLSDAAAAALMAWHHMRGLEWGMVPVMMSLYAVDDGDLFAQLLCVLRDRQA